MSIFRRFIDLNVKLSRLCNLRNLGEYVTHVEYLRLAALLFSAPDVKRVMDVAAGANWQFPYAYQDAYGLELSGMDIDADAVNANTSLDFRYTGDACCSSRIGVGNYDLLTCYSGIEHFPDVQSFLENAFASLRPGGALIAQFPSPLAPFAILNRLLPQRFKKNVLSSLFRSKADELGHPIHYDKCRFSEFKAAAERAGFHVEYGLRWYMSSGYFTWLFPLFMLSQLVDIIRLILGTKDMASYNLFVLRRPGDHFLIKWSWHSDF